MRTRIRIRGSLSTSPTVDPAKTSLRSPRESLMNHPISDPKAPVTEIVRALAAVQKSPSGAPAYSRFVNRPLGRVLAAGAFKLSLTPDQVTGISALSSFAGIVFVAVMGPGPLMGTLIALLLVLGYALDSADGQLARLRGGGSVAGEWLDHVVDCVKISSLHLAVLVFFFRHGEVEDVWLGLPILYTVVSGLFFFAYVLGDLLKRTKSGGLGKSAVGGEGTAPLRRSLLTLPTDYGLLAVSFVLLGFPKVFLGFYLLLLAGNIAYLVIGLPRWYRQMRALDG